MARREPRQVAHATTEVLPRRADHGLHVVDGADGGAERQPDQPIFERRHAVAARLLDHEGQRSQMAARPACAGQALDVKPPAVGRATGVGQVLDGKLCHEGEQSGRQGLGGQVVRRVAHAPPPPCRCVQQRQEKRAFARARRSAPEVEVTLRQARGQALEQVGAGVGASRRGDVTLAQRKTVQQLAERAHGPSHRIVDQHTDRHAGFL